MIELVKKAMDWAARKLTWDGKGWMSVWSRRINLGPLGVAVVSHYRFANAAQHSTRAPRCWRPWHLRVWWSGADRWLRWRFGRCTLCGASWSWWETRARGWVSSAQSGSQWHRLCAVERTAASILRERRDERNARVWEQATGGGE